MTKEELSWSIRKIIALVAGVPIAELADDHLLRDELMLDSPKEMEILARTEMQFGISLDEGQVVGLKTLGDYYELVAKAVMIRSS